MAKIDFLLDRISNPELRAQLQREFMQLQRQKKFGLIFEEHLPEATILYEVEIRRGQKVTLKADPLKKRFEVVSINAGNARCISIDEKNADETVANEQSNSANNSDDTPSFSTFPIEKSTYPNAYFPNGSIYRNQCSYCRNSLTDSVH